MCSPPHRGEDSRTEASLLQPPEEVPPQALVSLLEVGSGVGRGHLRCESPKYLSDDTISTSAPPMMRGDGVCLPLLKSTTISLVLSTLIKRFSLHQSARSSTSYPYTDSSRIGSTRTVAF